MIKIKIPLKLPDLNEFIAKCKIQRGTWNAGNSLKRKTQDDLFVFLLKLPQIKRPARIHFIWHEQNKRRDPDNIAFAKKFILDAMQECGRIANDGQKNILGFIDDVICDGSYAVEMIIEEGRTNENKR